MQFLNLIKLDVTHYFTLQNTIYCVTIYEHDDI